MATVRTPTWAPDDSMQFKVIGVTGAGEFAATTFDAPDAVSAHRLATERGVTVVEVSAASFAGSLGASAVRAKAGRSFKLDLFCQELLALLTAGITLGEALDTLAAKERERAGERVIESLLTSVREGKLLSAAMADRPDVFPALLVESVRASERTSDYVPSLTRFVRYRKLAAEMKAKVAAASVYPLILLGVSSLVLLFLIGYVVPRFAGVYADMADRLPAASRFLLTLGQAIEAYPLWFALGMAGLLVAIVQGVRSGGLTRVAISLLRRSSRMRGIFDAAALARMYRTLALLIHGGIPLVHALRTVRGLLSAELLPRLEACERAISEGRSFSESMNTHQLSTVVADRFFRVGERTGRLAEMVDRAADFHEDEIARAADWAGRVVGPVLMLVMGGVIGLVVVLMYLPIFQLSDALQ